MLRLSLQPFCHGGGCWPVKIIKDLPEYITWFIKNVAGHQLGALNKGKFKDTLSEFQRHFAKSPHCLDAARASIGTKSSKRHSKRRQLKNTHDDLIG
jgi:hypothetical protein